MRAWLGCRGALVSGALSTPGRCPRCYLAAVLVSDDKSRIEIERAWAASVPTAPGRDLSRILAAARDGELAALVVGGLDPDDLPDPALAAEAWERVGFLVSLEVRASAVTERADVVLPVAPPLRSLAATSPGRGGGVRSSRR